MKGKIRTYEDLEREEQLLEELLRSQKELLQLDVYVLKQQLKPAHTALQFMNNILTPDRHNPLLTQGTNTVIDLVLKKFLLAKSGWVTKMLVPFFVKNYSSHLLHDNKDIIVNKVFSLFSSKDGKGKTSSTAAGSKN